MNLNEIIQVLLRRKLMVISMAALVVGFSYAAIRLATPIYESTSSVLLRPSDESRDALIFFGVANEVMPVYADAAKSSTTREQASSRTGGRVARISVSTFRDTPIMRIKARDPDRELARDYAQAVTDVLVDRVQSGDVGIAALELTELDHASLPSDPVFPNTSLSLTVAALLGLLFGVGAALVRETLTTNVETMEALARIAEAPCIGEIPNEAAVSRLSSPEDLVTVPRLRVVSEALRDLRTNLLFGEESLSSLVVTSPEGSHGKTTVAVGLASTLARAGARTLLVDADLRRGRISELLRIQRAPGLTELLTGAASNVEDVVQPTSMTGLDVLSGGRLLDDPGEVLLSEISLIIDRLEELYDIVVIDATPLVPVNDARIVARFAKATLIVASAETTTRRSLRTAVDRLALIGVRPTAVVLNNARREGGRGYYGYLDPAQPKEEPRPTRVGA